MLQPVIISLHSGQYSCDCATFQALAPQVAKVGQYLAVTSLPMITCLTTVAHNIKVILVGSPRAVVVLQEGLQFHNLSFVLSNLR